MASRVFAYVLLVWFTVIALLALKGVCSTHTLTPLIESFSSARHEPFDVANWSLRWMVFNAFLLGTSLLALLGCLLVVYNQSWGFVLVATSFFLWANISWVMKASHAHVYRWEGFNFTSNVLFSALAAVCLVLFVLAKRDARIKRKFAS
jgi:hypothetical protein